MAEKKNIYLLIDEVTNSQQSPDQIIDSLLALHDRTNDKIDKNIIMVTIQKIIKGFETAMVIERWQKMDTMIRERQALKEKQEKARSLEQEKFELAVDRATHENPKIKAVIDAGFLKFQNRDALDPDFDEAVDMTYVDVWEGLPRDSKLSNKEKNDIQREAQKKVEKEMKQKNKIKAIEELSLKIMRKEINPNPTIQKIKNEENWDKEEEHELIALAKKKIDEDIKLRRNEDIQIKKFNKCFYCHSGDHLQLACPKRERKHDSDVELTKQMIADFKNMGLDE